MPRYNVYGTPKQGYCFDMNKCGIHGHIETQFDSFTDQGNLVVFFNKRRYVLDPTVAVEKAQGFEMCAIDNKIVKRDLEEERKLGMSFEKFALGTVTGREQEVTELPSDNFTPDGFSY